jgi:phosphoenolpyruvate carboxykinase (ATP)
LNAVLDGRLATVKFTRDPVFGFEVPTECADVPAPVLDPASSWHDRDVYMQKYRQLASRFVENFKKFETGCPPEVVKAGPTI